MSSEKRHGDSHCAEQTIPLIKAARKASVGGRKSFTLYSAVLRCLADSFGSVEEEEQANRSALAKLKKVCEIESALGDSSSGRSALIAFRAFIKYERASYERSARLDNDDARKLSDELCEATGQLRRCLYRESEFNDSEIAEWLDHSRYLLDEYEKVILPKRGIAKANGGAARKAKHLAKKEAENG